MPELLYRWETELKGLSSWDSLVEHRDVLKSFPLASAVHEARLPGMELFYLIGERPGSGMTEVICPVFLYTTSLEVLSPRFFKRFSAWVRGAFPDFLVCRALVIGTPLPICSDLILRRSETILRNIAQELAYEWTKKGLELGAQFVVIKEAEQELLETLSSLKDEGFIFVPSMPSATLSLDSSEGSYMSRLRKSYRVVYKTRKNQFEEGGGSWLEFDAKHHNLAEIHRLYLQVLERSNSKFELMPANFFLNTVRYLPDGAKLLIACVEERIVGFALIIFSKEYLCPIYIGMDYSIRDKLSLYYNILYRSIEEAELRRIPLVKLGQTAYESKALIGASFAKVYLAIKPLSFLSGLILRVFRKLLFPAINPTTRNVFKSAPKKAMD